MPARHSNERQRRNHGASIHNCKRLRAPPRQPDRPTDERVFLGKASKKEDLTPSFRGRSSSNGVPGGFQGVPGRSHGGSQGS